MEGRRYGDGLHQALEAKEKIKVQQENQTLASTTYQNYFKLYNNTMQFNVTGQPAISLPLYTGQDELPIGVQFGAPYGDEKTLLKLAKQLEEAAPWKDKRPSCFVG